MKKLFGFIDQIKAKITGSARTLNQQDGAITAEYAIAMLAAVGFAGVLVVLLKGDVVSGLLTSLVQNALSMVS